MGMLHERPEKKRRGIPTQRSGRCEEPQTQIPNTPRRICDSYHGHCIWHDTGTSETGEGAHSDKGEEVTMAERADETAYDKPSTAA